MQEFWEFDVHQPLEDLNEPLGSGIIKELVEKNAKDMAIYLSYYYRGEGGLVENVEWADNLYFENATSGNFKVRFDIVYFNACLDIHTGNKNDMLIFFNLNTAKGKLRLNGPHWPERGPDEI